MKYRFDDDELKRLHEDSKHKGKYSEAIVKAFRKRMQLIRAAIDERDFGAMRSWRFERLKGIRKHQYSIRLNNQWRLILEFESASEEKRVVIKDIEDYH